MMVLLVLLMEIKIRERFEIHLMIKINGKKLRRFEVSMTSLSSRMLKMM